MNDICGTCKFFLKIDGNSSQCRRYPPIQVQHFFRHPSVVEDTPSCGEFKDSAEEVI